MLSRLRFVVLFAAVACGSSKDSTSPPPSPTLTRSGHALVYDEAHHQVLLFGGRGSDNGAGAADQNSLWRYDGAQWVKVTASGPSPRHNASMAYDSQRGVVVMYGGRSGTFPNEALIADTWEWDGSTWTQKGLAGPGARVHQSMAYDRARGRTILFGGFDPVHQIELTDIWEWDGSTWTQHPATVNGAVALGAAYDEKSARLLLFTDDGAGAIHADVWDGASLTRRPEPVPSCFANPVSLGASRGGLFSAAYCANSAAMTSAVFDGTSWSAISGSQPTAPRYNYAFTYDRSRDRVILFGGETTNASGGTEVLSDTWEWDGSSWAQTARQLEASTRIAALYAAMNAPGEELPRSIDRRHPPSSAMR